jgi:tryptophan synthase alpha chain
MTKKKLFIPFLMAGHPTLSLSLEAILVLANNGADIIELGVPFSDPIADGPINQQAAKIALEQGTTLAAVLDLVYQVRAQGCHTPIVIFSYFNPILAMGIAAFAHMAKQCGVNGVLIVDLPPEEGQDTYHFFKKIGLEIVLLASPTTEFKRFDLYQKLSPLFIYYISRLGVTGTQHSLSDTLPQEIRKIRQALPHFPIAVGFGVSSCEQVKKLTEFSDAIIIGSWLVKTLEEQGITKLTELANQIRLNI